MGFLFKTPLISEVINRPLPYKNHWFLKGPTVTCCPLSPLVATWEGVSQQETPRLGPPLSAAPGAMRSTWRGAVPMKPQGDGELIGRHHLEGTPKLEGPVCMDFELMFFFLGGG